LGFLLARAAGRPPTAEKPGLCRVSWTGSLSSAAGGVIVGPWCIGVNNFRKSFDIVFVKRHIYDPAFAILLLVRIIESFELALKLSTIL
jgi:hypothetical protein